MTLKQTINFYQAPRKIEWQSLPLRFQIMVWIGLISGIIILYGCSLYYQHYMSQKLDTAKHQLSALKHNVNRLKVQLTQLQDSAALDEKVNALSGQLKLKQKYLNVIQQYTHQNQVFSSVMTGLARHHVKGTWLTGIHIESAGDLFSFEGQATSAKLVPKILLALKKEGVFNGKTFEQMEIKRPEIEKNTVHFSLKAKMSTEK